jgi:hypothetical protein
MSVRPPSGGHLPPKQLATEFRMSPRKRSGRVLRVILWGGLGAWALALAVFYVVRSAGGVPEPGDLSFPVNKNSTIDPIGLNGHG